MILSTIGRGGEGDVGQRIRDEILVIQALIDYISSDFDIGVYWKTLNDNGITKERLLSYDRAIHSEPNFRRDQKEGLLRDLGNYMRTLKWVLPSRQPDGTKAYKNRALITPFTKVAIICNHQRSVSKCHGAQMSKLNEKIDELQV
ncbi:hypothetical protein Fmac_017978 [Flemingia macrophylla]|uniref:DNA topoisomerase I catalytic core eukaryotic-type domain-containing protein n=1 Tax=Flemingia macrophylla TaxID=520843 RepID=A0ABD1M3K7_9FABA